MFPSREELQEKQKKPLKLQNGKRSTTEKEKSQKEKNVRKNQKVNLEKERKKDK